MLRTRGGGLREIWKVEKVKAIRRRRFKLLLETLHHHHAGCTHEQQQTVGLSWLTASVRLATYPYYTHTHRFHHYPRCCPVFSLLGQVPSIMLVSLITLDVLWQNKCNAIQRLRDHHRNRCPTFSFFYFLNYFLFPCLSTSWLDAWTSISPDRQWYFWTYRTQFWYRTYYLCDYYVCISTWQEWLRGAIWKGRGHRMTMNCEDIKDIALARSLWK